MEYDKQNDIPPAGTLQKTEDVIMCIEWTLTNLHTALQKKKMGVIARSPAFRMKDATWRLELLYCNLLNQRRYTGHDVFVSVNKHQSEIASHAVNCQIVVKAAQHVIGGYVVKKCIGENGKFQGFIAESQQFLSSVPCGGNVQVSCTFYQEVKGRTTEEIPQDVSDNEKESKENAEGIDILLSQMKNLFLGRENCDFVIRVKSREFQVHKAILSARSSVLASMLQRDIAEKRNATEIVDCEPDIFEHPLIYLYSGRVKELSWENAMSLYTLGDKYNLEHLREECVEFMEDNLCVDAFCDVIILGVEHNQSTLVKKAEEFFLKNATEILSTAKWLLLMKDHPVTCNQLYIKLAVKN